MNGLLNQMATVYLPVTSEHMGREVVTWEEIGTVKCRFTQPNTSLTQIATGANVERVDYIVFADLRYVELISVEDDGHMQMTTPVRLAASLTNCVETFEMKNPPRVIPARRSPHHVEFGVVRVEQ